MKNFKAIVQLSEYVGKGIPFWGEIVRPPPIRWLYISERLQGRERERTNVSRRPFSGAEIEQLDVEVFEMWHRKDRD